MLQTTRLERYGGNGLVAKRNSQNFSKFNEHGAATCPCNCRAISKSFSDILSEKKVGALSCVYTGQIRVLLTNKLD